MYKMTKEEEIELYNRMKDGDSAARDQLILGHSYLAIKIAEMYSHLIDFEDLQQEAFASLIKCADKYDANKGRLRSYAYNIMKTDVLRFLSKSKHFIRLPEPQVHQMLNLRAIKDELQHELQREVTYEDLLESEEVKKQYKKYSKTRSTKFSFEEYVKILDFSHPVISLDEPLSEDNELITLSHMISDSYDWFKEVEYEDIEEKLMECLTDQEKSVLLCVKHGLTGNQIGEQLGLAASSISTIKLGAIEKIKNFTKDNPELAELIETMGFAVYDPDEPENPPDPSNPSNPWNPRNLIETGF